MAPFIPNFKRPRAQSASPFGERPATRVKREPTPDQALPSGPEAVLPNGSVEMLDEISLSTQQHEAFELIVSKRRNVYLTGSAGSGKSTLVKHIAQVLSKLDLIVMRTGPTGRAASEINGITLHSFCGWSPKESKRAIRELERKAEVGHAQARFVNTDVLIIDEISMVSNYMLERLNRVLKIGRNNEAQPFGGVQIIVCGDFCQLPPVKPFETCFRCGSITDRSTRNRQFIYTCRRCGNEEYDNDKWAFCAQAWEEAEFMNIYLEENHRQKDPQFVRILDRLRLKGKLTHVDLSLLLNHPSSTKDAIELYPLRREVQTVNEREFKKLPGSIIRYKCLDYFWSSPKHPSFDHRKERSQYKTLKYLDYDQHPYDMIVELKLGTPVLLLANLDVEGGLINGSRGIVVDFEIYDEARVPRSRSGIGHNEDEGNVETQEYINFRGGELAKLRSEQMVEFICSPENKSKKWPIVEFLNGRRITVFADACIEQLGDEPPYTLEGRTQIPLMPVWAMTLHKAQGLSLEKVVVSLENKFEAGQAYVALSRAKNLSGLTVQSIGNGFGESDVDKTVQAFHESIDWDIGSLPSL